MKVAIHARAGSFSDRWIDYCRRHGINFEIVNCYSTDIIEQLRKGMFTHLMWHVNHALVKDLLVFPYVLNSADYLGIKTFPNFQSRWHFDDKVAQKYLLEALGAPLVQSDVFYDQDEAIDFSKKTTYPIVVKLKRGAGASNVRLLSSQEEAVSYINTMFGEGINSVPKAFSNIDQKFRVLKKLKSPKLILNKIFSFFKKNRIQRQTTNIERGYAYFQKFLDENTYDTRIIVVGNKAFGIRRFNRDNDFRASGSGKIDYDVTKIDTKMLALSFEISKSLKTQTIAFDFVYEKGIPKLIEMCFGFTVKAYDNCPGYWDSNLTYIKGSFNPQEFMIEDFLKE